MRSYLLLVIGFLVALLSFTCTASVTIEGGDSSQTQLCNINVSFLSPFEKQRSTFKLNESATLTMTQLLAKRDMFGAKLATNLYCQELNGLTYTGSEEEWKGFFQNTTTTLASKGAKNITLTLLGEDAKVYRGGRIHREYKFMGDFKEGHQVIYNLAVLDIELNVMYTFSVSGDFSIEKYVLREFKRAIESSSL